jgi:agmatinase
MSESAQLPFNFGGIDEPQLSEFDSSRILILPISYEGTVSYGTGTGAGAMAIVEASRNMELYEEETDSEVYKLGIHTLDEFRPRETPELMMSELYDHTKDLLRTDKFVCMLGGEHSVSAPVIRAHAEKYHNMSVLQIDAHADLRDTYDGTPHSHASIMARVVKDMRIPSVQVGIRSISADEARLVGTGIPTKIFWAKDIVGKTDWIDSAIDSLTETPEPGGLGWYETLTLIRKLAERKRIIGMDLVEYSYFENYDSPAFLCAKLVYKSLAYIFKNDSPKVMGAA